MFKRRDSRPWWQIVLRFFYPLGGWGRAMTYLRHRLGRLPDSSERIARGIGAGVFVSFTPFFGFHFLAAAIVARIINGNILAGLVATIFGNPLSFVPIAATALGLGRWILGQTESPFNPDYFGWSFFGQVKDRFFSAFGDLWHNFMALFTDATAQWGGLSQFFDELFLPYLIGGALIGVVVAGLCYLRVEPIIRGYQSRREKRRAARLERHAAKAAGNSAPSK